MNLLEQNREGIGNHVPLFAVVDPYQADHPSLKETKSFFNSGNKDILISAIKKSEDGDKVCIRLYNTSGSSQEATLHSFANMSHVTKTNLIEQPLQLLQHQNNSNTIQLQFKKNDIETLTTVVHQ